MSLTKLIVPIFLALFLFVSHSHASQSYQEEFYCNITALYEVNVNEMYDLILESGQLGSIEIATIQRYDRDEQNEIDEYTKWWLDEYSDSISDAVKSKDIDVIKKDKDSIELYLKITRNGIISILNSLGAGLNKLKYISSFDVYELNLESFYKKASSNKSQKQSYVANNHLVTVHVYDSDKGFVTYYIHFEPRGPIPVNVKDGQREPR